MDSPEHVYGIHPRHDGQSFEEYLNLVIFYYVMVAFKKDYKKVFDKLPTQNIFISNMDHLKLLWSKVNHEHCSSKQSLADKYKNENFLNTLGQLVGQL